MNTVRFRASAAPIWVFCSEAPHMFPLYENTDSEQSREGTAAHEMGELLLTSKVGSLDELTGRQAKNGVVMTGEMIPHVQMYVDHIRNRGVNFWIEESIHIETRHPNNPVTGKCDGAAFGFDQNTGILYIDDFKYGQGNVEPVDNWQLIIYAIGIIAKYGLTISKVVLTIIQPRAYNHFGPIRSWPIHAEAWAGYAPALQNIIDRNMQPPATEYASGRQCMTGNHCRYCPHLANCTPAKKAAINAVDVVMSPIPNTDTPEQVAYLLNTLDRASKALKHTYTAIEARAIEMIIKGQVIPGYSNQPGKGNAVYTNPVTAKATALGLKINLSLDGICTPAEGKRRGMPDAINNSLKHSPATAPKLIKFDAAAQADKDFANV